MILTTHALTGAVIGKNISDPWLIITLSIIIHFLMDRLRHGEYISLFNQKNAFQKSGWKITADISVGLSIIISVIYFKDFSQLTTRNILLGTFFSMFPDLITFFYWLTRSKILEKYYQFHSWIHKYPRHAPERQWTLPNTLNDILISAIALTLLFI